MAAPQIRHVRYDDFINLTTDGVGNLDGFKRTADELVRQMGTLHHHHVLVDLRRAVIEPIPEIILVEAVRHLHRLGLGVRNRIAMVTDPDDHVRTDRVQAGERIARLMDVNLRGFQDYAEALEWLNEPAPTP